MPNWLDKKEVLFFHSELLVEYGGLAGPPRDNALESTLARPRNLLAYESKRRVFELAACYGFGFARNHCFPDGNKRIALVSMDVFLQVNGFELIADEVETVALISALAAGEMSEAELALWVETNARAVR